MSENDINNASYKRAYSITWIAVLVILIFFVGYCVNSPAHKEFYNQRDAVITNIEMIDNYNFIYTFRCTDNYFYYAKVKGNQHVVGDITNLSVDSFYSTREPNSHIGYYTNENGTHEIYKSDIVNRILDEQELNHLLVDYKFTEVVTATLQDIVYTDGLCLYRFITEDGISIYSYAKLSPNVVGDVVKLNVKSSYQYSGNNVIGLYIVNNYIYGYIYLLEE